MPWTVTWKSTARDELARIWLAAGNRQAVADSANRIDRILKTSPEFVGQEFYGDRLYVDAPLVVVYTLQTADWIVDVIHVWARRT
jgi:hypothetical protein